MGIEWRPTIGDPTWVGWITFLGYGLAALACGRRSFLEWRNRSGDNAAVIGCCLAIAMLLLGANKQLDFQTLGIQVLRNLAREEGWYHLRRLVQALAVLVAIAGAILLLWFLGKSRSHFIRQNRLAAVGGLLILSYLLIRLANINHIIPDPYAASAWLSVLEIGGIGCLLTSGFGSS